MSAGLHVKAKLWAGGAAKLVPLGSVREFGDELARGLGQHPQGWLDRSGDAVRSTVVSIALRQGATPRYLAQNVCFTARWSPSTQNEARLHTGFANI